MTHDWTSMCSNWLSLYTRINSTQGISSQRPVERERVHFLQEPFCPTPIAPNCNQTKTVLIKSNLPKQSVSIMTWCQALYWRLGFGCTPTTGTISSRPAWSALHEWQFSTRFGIFRLHKKMFFSPNLIFFPFLGKPESGLKSVKTIAASDLKRKIFLDLGSVTSKGDNEAGGLTRKYLSLVSSQ